MENLDRGRASLVNRAGRVTVALLALTGVMLPIEASVANTATPHVTPTSVDLLTTTDHWQLAGVTADPANHRLNVRNTGLAIVNQDGTPNQINPPVNLYGVRVKASGPFSVTTSLTGIKGAAEVSLYGKPPLIEDEFRAEEGTLDMKISGTTFTATVSDQIYGKGAHKLQKTIPLSSNHTVSMTDSAGNLRFNIDGQSTSSIPDDGIFKTGNVYVGLDALSTYGSFVVNKLSAKSGVGGQVSKFDGRTAAIHPSSTGFAAQANIKRPGFIVGAAVAPGPMVSDLTYDKLLGNYNGISVENALKMQTSHPLPGNSLSSYNFTEGDAEVAMARKAGMRVHGHALVFGEANPAWVQNIAKNHPEQLRQVMTDHVTTVMQHYKGKIASWDVVNEPLADYGAPAGQLNMRKNIWYNAMGPDYLVYALKAARAADPSAELCIQDFGTVSDDDRAQQMIDLVQYIRSKGGPIDCVGEEAHIDNGDTNAANTHIDISQLRSHIQSLAAIGIKARISELDVSDTSEFPVFGDVVTACIDEPDCEGVTTWGVTNKYSSGGDIDSKGIFTPGIGLPWNKYEQPTAVVTYINNAL